MKLTAVYQKNEDGYIGFIEELPGANSQGATIEGTRENLREAAMMVLEANRSIAEEELTLAPVLKETIEIYETP